jgi:parallel beta-helix repeat protein
VSTLIVSSVTQLNATLHTAHAGDVIELSPGTYSGVSIKGLNAGGVTITSQDTSNEAVLTGLQITSSSGLTFSGLEFSFPMGDGTWGPHGITVKSSQDIHFASDSIHGVLNGDPTNDVIGIGFADSSNVSLTNSELQELRAGITVGSSDHVTISGNNIHDLRIDGIEGAGDDTVTISDNTFSNFHHVGTSATGGDHSDAIQFWTTNQTVGTSNLTITNNVIVQGAGRDMQGIFLQDLTGKLPYQNLTVTGNLIIGGNWNGILVEDAKGLTLSDNIVAPTSTEIQTPWIKVTNSDGATVSNNTAKTIGLTDGNSHLTESGDSTTGAVSDGGVSMLTSWLASHSHLVPMGPKSAEALVHPGGASAPASDPSETAAAAAADDTSDASDGGVSSDSTTPAPAPDPTPPPAPTPAPDPTTPDPSSSFTPASTESHALASDGHSSGGVGHSLSESDLASGYTWASYYGSFWGSWSSTASSVHSYAGPGYASAVKASDTITSATSSADSGASDAGSGDASSGSGASYVDPGASSSYIGSSYTGPSHASYAYDTPHTVSDTATWMTSMTPLIGMHMPDGMSWMGFFG